MKRAIDLILAVPASVLAIPVVVVAAAVVRWNDGAPSFYASYRVGEGGRLFRLYKIRTMREGSESGVLGSVTTADDPRVTSTGRILRRWKVDELPQLLNVLLGDMSLVGPRPETPEYVALFTAVQREILRYRPGLTSPASIAFMREAELLAGVRDPVTHYVEAIMPEEIRIDLAYMRRATTSSDLGVIMKTAIVTLRNIGVPHP
jgi:lipopolysaccharide/colanic/teichoic acid biosynthesis glycosyltransferase